MRILIACEFSGIVRDAFRSRGHDAWSCDLLCCERGPKWHIRDDVRLHLHEQWDLVIAHPPCTYLSYAATSSWDNPGRKEKRDAAFEFFMDMYDCPCDHVAVENPVGWPNTVFRKPDQIVKPFQFGERKRKRVCLWLRNLPLLTPTNTVDPPEATWIHNRKTGKGQKNSFSMDTLWPSCATRAQRRSRFFEGIASAMAEQWGRLDLQ